MPLYEYRCRACGAEFELLRRASAMDAPVSCPACSASLAERKVSTFIVNGWTRGKPRPAERDADGEPDEYELVPTDHSDEEDWADF